MTMAALAQAFQEKHLQDWLKGALATLFAKQGLEDFVADELTKFQKDLLTSIFKNKAIPEGTVCNTCTTENVLSCPPQNFCSKGECKLHDQSKSDKRPNHPCPKNVCQYIRDAIRQEHRHNSPSWTNTNATKWCIDSIEIAKCYMPLDDYVAVTTLKETGFNGILSVIMNNNRFKEKMVDTDHACTKALDIWHKIRHSEDISLRDGELTEYADTLIDLLSDPKYLAADQKAQLAVQQLKQLKSNTLTINTEDITGVIDEIMNDLVIMQKVNNATTKEMAKTNGSKIQVNTRLLQQLLFALKSTLSSIQTATVSNLDEMISTEVTSIETKWKEDLDTIPSDLDLVDIARAIGLNWELLGIHLGLSTTEIDHIKMDYPTSQTRIYRMLYIWRKEEGLNGTKRNLFSAMRIQASVNVDWKALFGKCLMYSTYEVHQPIGEMLSSPSMDFNISSIEDALAQPPETIVSIAISVLAIGPVKEYTNKANQARRYYSFTVGDATAHTTGRSYLMKQQTTFVPGKSLLLQGLVRKTGEESLWAVSSTKVVDWVSVTVPDNVRAAAASPIKQKGEVTPLAKAVISNSPCTVVGKIVQKSPLKHRRNGELPTKFIRITDATDGPCVKVALFGEDALREYKPGDVVSVSDAYKWKTSTTLSTKKSSQIEFLPSDSIAVDIQSQPLLMDDPDFDDDKKPNTEPEEFTVMGVQSAHAYQCCSYPGECERETPVDVTDSATGQTDVVKSMREDLIMFYRKHHSTLSVSPLVEEHDVQLTDFYVQPKLTVIDIQRRFGILGKTQRRTPILSYRDLFCQGGNEFYKDIYVTAKAGVGKTSFAKRICMTWCQAHSRDRLLDEKFRSEDVEEMRKFDLLLMLSLRDTDPTICDLDSMTFSGLIRDLARRSMYSIDVLEDMLQQRTCLVILDGLDEWTHPAACDRGSWDVHNLPHTPARELCTVMITTRPWKFDVIQLKMKQIDRHVEINELDDQLSEQLTSNAVTILNEHTIPDKAKTTEEFKTATSPRRVDSVKYIPYILLQMICLWFEGKTIGKSKCEIYSNIIELTLSRGLMKLQRKGVSTRKANLAYTNKVPFFVKSNKLSKMHYDVLLGLGKVAFETLFSSKMESRLIFDMSAVLGTLSEGTLTFCLQMGLLSQRKDETTISSRTSKLSFQHKSIQEYFSALYIQSCLDSQDVQDKILQICVSLAAIIEMADVFIFIGGFCQETCEKVLKMLYPITSTSETTQIYRNSQSQYELSFQDRKSHEMIKSFQMMQIEIAQELKDSGSKKINFCIEDILIDRTFDEEQLLLLKHLTENSGNIKSLGINCGSEDEFRKVLDTVELQKLCFLQKFRIFGVPGHEDLHRLLSDGAQTLTCLCLSFCINENNQYFSAHQTISPETIRTITNMNLLQSINLWNIHLEHPQMEAFFKFLCRKETMTEITLSGMKCTEHGGKCESHSIDLSQHGKLRLLHLAFISVSDIRVNSSSLDTCIFGPLPTQVHESLVRCLQGASCLKSLHINNGKLLGDMPEILPRLGQLRMFGVMGIDLCEKALTLPPDLKYIENVIFYMVTMSNAALKLFVESVNVLPQPVTIGLTECNVKLSKDDEQRIDYEIRSSSGYKVITDDSTWFKFHTCKQL